MNALKELLYSLGSFCAGMLRMTVDWFNGLELFNKVIVVNTVTAFFAIVLPIARYYIFETWFVINNPLAVYMILIAFIMVGTIFLRAMLLVFLLRVVINGWYLVAIIYLWATHTFSSAPYEVSYGIIFNIAAPVVYGAASVMIYFQES